MVSLPSQSLRTAQLVLSGLCVCLAVAIIGTAADVFAVYKAQRAALNPWWLPLWPDHFDTSSTPALIGTGAAIAVLHLAFIVASSIPRFTLFQSPKFATLLAMLVIVPGSLLALFGIIFAHVLNTHSSGSRNTDTIMTWTCRFRNAAPASNTLGIEANMSNELFGKLCDESRFAYYGMIPLLVLQLFMIVPAVLGLRQPSMLQRQFEKSYESSPERSPPGTS